jgi:hypothetical protein
MDPSMPAPLLKPINPATRSTSPKVVGILAIVFSVVGLFYSVMESRAYRNIYKLGLEDSDLGNFGTWIPIYMAIAVLVFGLHLTGGIFSVRYSPRCIKWMNVYAVAALLLAAANITVTALTYPEVLKFTDGHTGRIVKDVVALSWPIVVLFLMNQRRTRLATSDIAKQKIPAATPA